MQESEVMCDYSKLKLREISEKILTYLRSFENNPSINKVRENYPMKTRDYFCTNSWAGKKYVYVKYISYQGAAGLNKQQAIEYLKWLDNGNVGTHYKAGIKSDGWSR